MTDEDGFLNRWSRRKLADKDRSEPRAEPDAEAASGPGGVEARGADDDQDSPERERHPAEDIDIESLNAESDFKIFLEAGVPAAVKRMALRKLWTTNPVYHTRDLLNDDFDLADVKKWGIGPVGGTSWKFGRYADEIEEDLKRAGKAEAGEAGEAGTSDPASTAEGTDGPPQEEDHAGEAAMAPDPVTDEDGVEDEDGSDKA